MRIARVQQTTGKMGIRLDLGFGASDAVWMNRVGYVGELVACKQT